MNVRINNFDLLRLFAATQVFVIHGIDHFSIDWIAIKQALSYFPGVPIFFVISGFLISASYERNPDIKQYAKNRILRIFPALWVCLFVSSLLAMFIGKVNFPLKEATLWLIAQASFLQFYNPEFLRGFGVGVLNGSLWTIPIELQFYAILPVIYRVIHRGASSVRLLVLFLVFFVFNFCYINFFSDRSSVFYKLIGVSIPAYLYLFVLGIILQRNYEKIARYIEGKFFVWIFIYVLLAFFLVSTGFSRLGNYLNPFLAIVLGITSVSFAFTMPNLSFNLIKGNDVSYGVYIYHMPVINVLIFLGMKGENALLISLFFVFSAAIISWVIVEKKALNLKKSSLLLVKR